MERYINDIIETMKKHGNFYQNYRANLAKMERFARRGHRAGTHAGGRNMPPAYFSRCARALFESLPKTFPKQKTAPDGAAFCFGGDGEIRTLEELLTLTRFPIVRARPTTRHLHVFAQEKIYPLFSLPIIIHALRKVKEFFPACRAGRRDGYFAFFFR